MYVRFQANQEDLQQFIADGIDLVWISSHADASPRCRHYQGKLYSISGKTGTINGIRYTPLSEALLGPLGDGNGCISGYNCRHRLIEYQTGSKAPNDYTEEEMKRHYQIDQRQRSYENQIRLLKTEERLFRKMGDLETAKRLRRRWRVLNNRYERYSLENGRAFYRWRTSIGDEENAVKQDVGTTLQTKNEQSKEFAVKPTRINTELYQGVFDNEFKPSNSVVITKERQTHYESRHPEVKGKEKEIIAAIQNPDIILLDDNVKSDGSSRKNSANILKLESSTYLHVSVKFIEEESGWYNSVMSVRIMSEKSIEKLICRL